MKALVLTALGGLEQLAVRDVPDPVLAAPDDVLVRIHAAGLNHLDLFVLGGLPGVEYQFPHIMVADGAGVVEAVGPAARRVAVGDRVMLNPGLSCYECETCRKGEHSLCMTYGLLGEHRHGTAAERIVLPERNVETVPPDMPWDQAGAFSLANLTAWRMLVTRAKLEPGETVLIWGIGGGVAQAALQIATLRGARTIVTSSSDEKLARAAALGADVGLNHTAVDVPKEVRRIVGGPLWGVDVVVDNVGAATWERSLRCLARQGRLVTCGGTSGPMVNTDVRKLFWYQWSILGSTMGNAAEYRAIAELAREGKLWPVVDEVFSLEDAPRAFQRLHDGDQFGKLVLAITTERAGAGGAPSRR